MSSLKVSRELEDWMHGLLHIAWGISGRGSGRPWGAVGWTREGTGGRRPGPDKVSSRSTSLGPLPPSEPPTRPAPLTVLVWVLFPLLMGEIIVAKAQPLCTLVPVNQISVTG